MRAATHTDVYCTLHIRLDCINCWNHGSTMAQLELVLGKQKVHICVSLQLWFSTLSVMSHNDCNEVYILHTSHLTSQYNTIQFCSIAFESSACLCHGAMVHLSACWCHGASLTHSRNFLLQARQHCTVSFSPSTSWPSSTSPSSSPSSSSTSSSTSSSSSHQITELARNKMLLHYINHHSLQPQPKIHQCFSNSHNSLPLFSPSRPIWMIWCPGSQLLNVPWWVWHHCIASTINASPQSSALPLQLYLILIVYALAILILVLMLMIIHHQH